MKKIYSVLIILAMSFSIFANSFTDVPFSHWAYDAVATLSAKGIITGFPDGSFKGERKITRYELSVILSRLLNKINSGISIPGIDVNDKKLISKLTSEFADELAILGVRVNDMDERLLRVEDSLSEKGIDVKRKFKASGCFESQLLSFDNDNSAIADDENGYAQVYADFTYTPVEDIKIFFTQYIDYNFQALAGNSLNLNTNTTDFNDLVLNFYVEYSDINFFDIHTFNTITMGRKTITLGNGLMFNGRLNGVFMEDDEFGLYLINDAGNTNTLANGYLLHYNIDENSKFYYVEGRNSATYLASAGDKSNGFGYSFKSDDFNAEFFTLTLDNGAFTGTEDTQNSFVFEYKGMKDLCFKYTTREAGMDQIVNGLGLPWNGYLEPNLDRKANVADMFLKYNLNDRFALAYENAQEDSGTAYDVTAITLGYTTKLKEHANVEISYTTLTSDEASNGTRHLDYSTGTIDANLSPTNDVNVFRIHVSMGI